MLDANKSDVTSLKASNKYLTDFFVVFSLENPQLKILKWGLLKKKRCIHYWQEEKMEIIGLVAPSYLIIIRGLRAPKGNKAQLNKWCRVY